MLSIPHTQTDVHKKQVINWYIEFIKNLIVELVEVSAIYFGTVLIILNIVASEIMDVIA